MAPDIPNALNYNLNALASLMRSWAADVQLQDHGQAAVRLEGRRVVVDQLPIALPVPEVGAEGEPRERAHGLVLLQRLEALGHL